MVPTEDIRRTDHSRQPYLALEHLSFSFGSNQVLNDISLSIRQGETACILGRSGAGKSVCLRLLMRFLKPAAGRVIVAHEDITDYAEPELERIHKKVTMVFQNGALFDSLTVADNVAFPLQERGQLDDEQVYQIVDGLLEMVNAKDFRDRFPGEISTGAKRLVAIARALAVQPEAILYDEPTTNVDPLMERRVGELIKNLKYRLGLTNVVVTHDMRLVQMIADHVVFIDSGKVIFYGTKEEMLQSSNPLVQQFWKLDLIDWKSILRIFETQRLAG